MPSIVHLPRQFATSGIQIVRLDAMVTWSFVPTRPEKSQMGFVVMDNFLNVTEFGGHPFHSGVREAHIFIQEMAAACWYVCRAVKHHGWRDKTIFVVVDNSAVAFCLKNYYSSNQVANTWLRELYMTLDQCQCRIEVIQVRSEDNAADDPSRGLLQLDVQRLERTRNAIRGAWLGQRTGTSCDEIKWPDNVARHPLDCFSLLDTCDTEGTAIAGLLDVDSHEASS